MPEHSAQYYSWGQLSRVEYGWLFALPLGRARDRTPAGSGKVPSCLSANPRAFRVRSGPSARAMATSDSRPAACRKRFCRHGLGGTGGRSPGCSASNPRKFGAAAVTRIRAFFATDRKPKGSDAQFRTDMAVPPALFGVGSAEVDVDRSEDGNGMSGSGSTLHSAAMYAEVKSRDASGNHREQSALGTVAQCSDLVDEVETRGARSPLRARVRRYVSRIDWAGRAARLPLSPGTAVRHSFRSPFPCLPMAACRSADH